MKKLLLFFLFIFSYTTIYAEEFYNIKLVNAAGVEKLEVLEVNKDFFIVKKDNNKKKIPISEIESYEKIGTTINQSFKKVIILTSNEVIEGYIIYQDRNKLSIQVDDSLKSFNLKDIKDIVSDQDFAVEKSKNKFGAMWRSAVIPGWGQTYSNNRFGFGILYLSTFLATTASGIYFYNTSQQYYDRYVSSKYKDVKYYHQYYLCLGLSLASFITSFSIYIWNIADAYIFFKYKFEALNVKSHTKISNINNEYETNRIEFFITKRL